MKDLFNSLTKTGRSLLDMALNGARLNFMLMGTVVPTVLMLKGDRVCIAPIPMEDKDAAAQAIKAIRMTCDAVVFITEAWALVGGTQQDIIFCELFGVANHPDKVEIVGVHFYQQDRVALIQAQIARPDGEDATLGEWECVSDSAKEGAMEGRFV